MDEDDEDEDVDDNASFADVDDLDGMCIANDMHDGGVHKA